MEVSGRKEVERHNRYERSVLCEARRGWLKDEKDKKKYNTKDVVKHETS